MGQNFIQSTKLLSKENTTRNVILSKQLLRAVSTAEPQGHSCMRLQGSYFFVFVFFRVFVFFGMLSCTNTRKPYAEFTAS